MDHLLKTKKESRTLKKLIQNTKYTKHIYKNELDKACSQHDMTYGYFKYLAKTTAANKVLKDKAFNIAKDLKYDIYQRA